MISLFCGFFWLSSQLSLLPCIRYLYTWKRVSWAFSLQAEQVKLSGSPVVWDGPLAALMQTYDEYIHSYLTLPKTELNAQVVSAVLSGRKRSPLGKCWQVSTNEAQDAVLCCQIMVSLSTSSQILLYRSTFKIGLLLMQDIFLLLSLNIIFLSFPPAPTNNGTETLDHTLRNCPQNLKQPVVRNWVASPVAHWYPIKSTKVNMNNFLLKKNSQVKVIQIWNPPIRVNMH